MWTPWPRVLGFGWCSTRVASQCPVPTQPVEYERDEYESSSDEDQAASDEGAVEAPAAATPAGKDAATVAAPGSSTTLEPLATPGPGVVATESD